MYQYFPKYNTTCVTQDMKLNNVNKIIFIMFHKKQQEDINKNERERNYYRQKKEDEREIILTRLLSQNFQLV